MKKSLVCLALAGAGLCFGAAAEPVAVAAHLVGEWRSPAPEYLGAFHAVRSFVFTDGAWALRLTTAADDKFAAPLFTLRIDGSYLLGTASRQVPSATEAVFFYSRRYVRAESAAGVDLFKKQGCVLELGVEKDISLTGCGFLPSIPASGIEYDLLSLKGDRLWLGERSGDLAKQRPGALSTLAVVRR